MKLTNEEIMVLAFREDEEFPKEKTELFYVKNPFFRKLQFQKKKIVSKVEKKLNSMDEETRNRFLEIPKILEEHKKSWLYVEDGDNAKFVIHEYEDRFIVIEKLDKTNYEMYDIPDVDEYLFEKIGVNESCMMDNIWWKLSIEEYFENQELYYNGKLKDPKKKLVFDFEHIFEENPHLLRIQDYSEEQEQAVDSVWFEWDDENLLLIAEQVGEEITVYNGSFPLVSSEEK